MYKRRTTWETASYVDSTTSFSDQKQNSSSHHNKVAYYTIKVNEKAFLKRIFSYYKREKHDIYKCRQNLSLPLKTKREFVTKGRLCFNCLSSSCVGCHHNILHELNYTRSIYIGKNTLGIQDESVLNIHQIHNLSCIQTSRSKETPECLVSYSDQVLLMIAYMNVIPNEGKKVKVRALFDTG